MIRIGRLAELSGESVKTLRYWHDRGLLSAQRTESGYRLFPETMTERVGFIRRVQRLGLTLADVRDILEVRDDGLRPCDEVRERLRERLHEVRERLAQLHALEEELEARLDWAQAHPLPECDDDCVYLR